MKGEHILRLARKRPWRYNLDKEKWVGSKKQEYGGNNAFYFGHVEIKLPELHSYFFYLSSLFRANFITLLKKYLKVELGLCFEVETAEYAGSILFIVYSMIMYSEKWPWKPHPYYC